MGGIESVRLLLDTHIIVWSAAEPENLPQDIREKLENDSNELWFSPISVWEILLLAEKGRIVMGSDIPARVRHIFQMLPLKEAAINMEVALQSRFVHLPHQDPNEIIKHHHPGATLTEECRREFANLKGRLNHD